MLIRRCAAALSRNVTSLSMHSCSAQSILITTNSINTSHAARKCIFQARLRRFAIAQRRHAATATAERQDFTAQPSSDSASDDIVPTDTVTKFKDLGAQNLVNPILVRTLTSTLRYDSMTSVQSMTISEALKGVDILAQAKTGTGKTIGFLLPVVQRILDEDRKLLSKPQRPPYNKRASDIRALIISPTRELAEQIGQAAKVLTQGTGIVVQIGVGGTQKRLHLNQMQREGCHILVGTPGRLKDIFSDESSGVSAPKLGALVLDEADRLLDDGFWPEIQDIQRLLPDQREKDRQTLMFSATVSRDVVQLVRQVMKPDLHFVRTVREDELPTHERVQQSVIVVPGLENQLPTLLEYVQREIVASQTPGSSPFKAIVYFNATSEVNLAFQIFMNLRRDHLHGTRVYDIHSRLSQAQRTAAADRFRDDSSAILFSSDVTARGMDFPHVTHVIQVGIPRDRDIYIHRIGRTARAGQEGKGALIASQAEADDIRRKLRDLPIYPDKSLTAARIDHGVNQFDAEAIPEPARGLFDAVKGAALAVSPEDKEKSYMAMLGIFQHIKSKRQLVEMMNRLAKVQWGYEEGVPISHALANKLNVVNIPGVVLSRKTARDRSSATGFSGGRGGGFLDARRPSGDFRNRDGRGSGGFSDEYSEESLGTRGSRRFGDRSSREVSGRRGARDDFTGRGPREGFSSRSSRRGDWDETNSGRSRERSTFRGRRTIVGRSEYR